MGAEHLDKRHALHHKEIAARQTTAILPLLGAASTGTSPTQNTSPAAVVTITHTNTPGTTTTPAPAPPPPAQAGTTTLTSTSTIAPPAPTTTSAPPVVVIVQSSTVTPTRSSSRSTLTSSSSIQGPSTSYATVIKSLSASGASLASAAASASSTSNGASTGTIIGAVAGALVGVVVLSGLIGLLFRAKFGKKSTDDDDPFARNFKRDSVRLPQDDSYDDMSQIARQDNYRGVGRSDTLDSGRSGGPRPPTFLQRHLDYAQAPYQSPPRGGDAYYGAPGYPQVQGRMPGDMAAWGPTYAAAGHYAQQPSRDGFSEGGLSRQDTQRSAYEQQQQHHDVSASTLPGVDEEAEEELPSRSGTPVDPNPQSAYYAHGSRNGSTDSPANERVLRSDHLMSVRNGDGYDPDDAYGGM